MSQADRGPKECYVKGCKNTPRVSVLVHVITFGGRKDRRKATSGAVRLCNHCVRAMAKGKLPAQLTEGIESALQKVGEIA